MLDGHHDRGQGDSLKMLQPFIKAFLASYSLVIYYVLLSHGSAAGSSLKDAVIYDLLSVTKSVFGLLFGNICSSLWCNFEIQDRSKDLILSSLSLMSCCIWVVQKALFSKVRFKADVSASEM